MDYNSLQHNLVDFCARVLTYLGLHPFLEEVQKWAASAATTAMEYGKVHPYRTAFTVVSVGLTPILGAGWMTTKVQF
jgi:hypothetical protein